MRSEQQLRSFLRVLEHYPEDRPLSKFLPEYFRRNKQMGSNDRRSAVRLLYNFYRLGRACASRPAEQRLFLAEFLCTGVDNPFLQYFRPDLNGQIGLPPDEKISIAEKEGLDMEDIFPFSSHLSQGVNAGEFSRSFFVQPDLYISMQPGEEDNIRAVLAAAAVPFEARGEATLALPNGTSLNLLFPDDRFPLKPYRIQDLSSQQSGKYFRPNKYEHWWDACAASGGKSLLLYSQEPDIKLVVSDIRESVLDNLDERFISAGLLTYQKKLIDLTQNPDQVLHHYEFDGIILDAPCSGSGTWGRTPEMISQFSEERIPRFQDLQKAIAANVIRYLKPGKPLIYITCSVFKEENEEVVEYLKSEFGLKEEAREVFKGYEHKADTMFAARLIMPQA